MLYRDIDMTGNTARDLQVSFTYRLRMSTGFGTAAATRVGWFDKDPLEVTAGADAAVDGIAGQLHQQLRRGAAGAPRDSFMVYVGAPVEGTFLASTGASLSVFDAQRRWFDEVVRANETGLYKEIHCGHRPSSTFLTTRDGHACPNSPLAPMLAASRGKVRLVFRVKTNRGFRRSGHGVLVGRRGRRGGRQREPTRWWVGLAARPAGVTFEREARSTTPWALRRPRPGRPPASLRVTTRTSGRAGDAAVRRPVRTAGRCLAYLQHRRSRRRRWVTSTTTKPPRV